MTFRLKNKSHLRELNKLIDLDFFFFFVRRTNWFNYRVRSILRLHLRLRCEHINMNMSGTAAECVFVAGWTNDHRIGVLCVVCVCTFCVIHTIRLRLDVHFVHCTVHSVQMQNIIIVSVCFATNWFNHLWYAIRNVFLFSFFRCFNRRRTQRALARRARFDTIYFMQMQKLKGIWLLWLLFLESRQHKHTIYTAILGVVGWWRGGGVAIADRVNSQFNCRWYFYDRKITLFTTNKIIIY